MKQLFFLTLVCSTFFAPAENYPVKTTTLSNGLKVIVCEKATNPMVEVEVWYRVGSKDEWDGIRGMAHMFEHMMFRGSKKFPGDGDIYIKLIEQMGGNVNAYTTFDRTVYHEEIQTKDLDKVLEMEADRMSSLVLDQKVLDTEREVVGEELRLGQNSWYQRMMEDRYKLLYPKQHPYAVDVIGFLPEITGFTTKQCQDFYDKFYSPNNAYVVIVGNVKAETVIEQVKKQFEPIKKQLPLNTKKQEPDIFSHPIEAEEMNIDFPVQIYSYVVPAPAFGHKDYFAFNFLSELLFENSNSLLNSALVTNGNMAYQIVCNNDQARLYNNFATYDVVMQAGMGNAKVKKVISKEINEIINEGVEQEILNDYISNLEARYVFDRYSNAQLAAELGIAEYYFHDHTKSRSVLEAYKQIKPDDLKQIAKTYFDPEKIKVINIKPTAD